MKQKTLIAQWRLLSAILLALTLMWLMPFGSFDPRQYQFYMCLGLAAVHYFVLKKALRYDQGSPLKMRRVIVQWHVMTGMLIALTLMWLAPFGSFNPKQGGFYVCIALAGFAQRLISKLVRFENMEDYAGD